MIITLFRVRRFQPSHLNLPNFYMAVRHLTQIRHTLTSNEVSTIRESIKVDKLAPDTYHSLSNARCLFVDLSLFVELLRN